MMIDSVVLAQYINVTDTQPRRHSKCRTNALCSAAYQHSTPKCHRIVDRTQHKSTASIVTQAKTRRCNSSAWLTGSNHLELSSDTSALCLHHKLKTSLHMGLYIWLHWEPDLELLRLLDLEMSREAVFRVLVSISALGSWNPSVSVSVLSWRSISCKTLQVTLLLSKHQLRR